MKLKKTMSPALASATLPLLVPAAAHAGSPQARVLKLRDACERASWGVEFPGLCTRSAGSVTLSGVR